MELQELWAKKNVRIGVIAAVAVVAVVFIASGMGGGKESVKERAAGQVVPVSIFGVNTAAKEIEGKEIDDIVDELQQQYSQKEQDLTLREKAQKAELEAVKTQLQDLQAATFEMNNLMKAMTNGGARNSRNNPAQNLATNAPDKRQGVVQGEDGRVDILNEQQGVFMRPQTQLVTSTPVQFENNVIRTITQRKVREVKRSGEIEEREIANSSISSTSQTVNGKNASDKPVKNETKGKADANAGEYTLTMGSIISGTTLNGVAAPTSMGSDKEPIPVLMRIKKEAVMPNHFTLDIRECHLLGSAKGNLADERVYIRAEAISCITEDGQSIEKNVTAYAVSSSDGMAGIRGEVVFRSNDMIANSMIAGFIGGFSEAATPKQIQSLNTNPTASSIWETQNLNRYAGAGMLKGASSAANRIADYYMEMADSTWPVIELLPGIQIDFIVQKGMTMQLDGDKAMRTE